MERIPVCLQDEPTINKFIARQTDSPYLQALKNSNLAKPLIENQGTCHWGDAEVIYDAWKKSPRTAAKPNFTCPPS